MTECSVAHGGADTVPESADVKWVLYREPTPPPKGMPGGLADRLSHTLFGFQRQASSIRTSIFSSGAGKARNKLLSTAAVFTRSLTGASEVAAFVLELATAPQLVHHTIGGRYRKVGALGSVVSSLELKRRSEALEVRICVWFNGQDVVGSLRTPGAGLCYIVATNLPTLTPADLRVFGVYLAAVRDQIEAAEQLRLALDKQRLLRRRTLVAQLRPNDMLYQILKRLRLHIPWQHGACILAATHEEEPLLHWYIAAERLVAVHETSRRIGRKYSAPGTRRCLAPRDIKDLVVADVEHLQRSRATRWERLIHAVLDDWSEMSDNSPRSSSALVVVLTTGSETTKASTVQYVLIASDTRKDYFTGEHLALARIFLQDMGVLLHDSDRFSKDLVQLWTEKEVGARTNAQAHLQEPDAVEALTSNQVAAVAPSVLGVDAIQAFQLRRGATKAPDGFIEILGALVIIDKEARHDRDPSRLDSFVEGLRPGVAISPAADLLWKVLTAGVEATAKEAAGIPPQRLACLVRVSYCSVFVTPILCESEVAGALVAYRLNPSEFIDSDRLLIRSLAARLGERFAFHRQLADHSRLLMGLSAIAAAESEAGAHEELVRCAQEMLQSDQAVLMRVERDGLGEGVSNFGRVLSDVAHTWQGKDIAVPTIEVDSAKPGLTGTAYLSGQPMVVSDVSKCQVFIPILRPNQEPIAIASELAVPVKSANVAEVGLGVLDTFWHDRHEISRRDVSTLVVLANHAATVLELISARDEANQLRLKLEVLVRRGRQLEGIHSHEDLWRWLSETVEEVIACDIVAIVRQVEVGEVIELVRVIGNSSDALNRKPSIPSSGWLGHSFEQFRRDGLGIAVERYDSPSEFRKHIPGTRRELSQSNLAGFFRSPRGEMDTSFGVDSDVLGAWLMRLSHSNFLRRDEMILRLAIDTAEAVIERLSLEHQTIRSVPLLEGIRDVSQSVLERARTAPEVVREEIAQQLILRLGAAKVVVLYYDEDTHEYDFPYRFVFPGKPSATERPPRPDGLCESLRQLGSPIYVEDVESPPDQVRSVVHQSAFLSENPEIRAFVGIPLFERSTDTPAYCGVLFVDFTTRRKLSLVEKEFLASMTRFLEECGRVARRLASMRHRVLSGLQELSDPRGVFRAVLQAAVEGIKGELATVIAKVPDLRVGGQLSMVVAGRDSSWTRLYTRATIGDLTHSRSEVQEPGEGIVGEVAQTGERRVVPDIRSLGREYVAFLRGMRSEVCVPIRLPGVEGATKIAGDVIGVINIEASKPGVFNDRHSQLLSLFAQPPVSVSLHLAERHRQILGEFRRNDDEFVLHAAHLLIHDISKPVRSASRRVQVIRDRWPGGIPGEVDELLTHMAQESNHWLRLLNTGLLFLSQEVLEERRALDVVEVVRGWAENQHGLPRVEVEKSEVDAFMVARGHADLLGQILVNLQENSSKALAKQEDERRIWITLALPKSEWVPGEAGP